MKKLSKIKLNQLSKAELKRRAMNVLKGGHPCDGANYAHAYWKHVVS